MAGDWLKWEKGLTDKVEVMQMASSLGVDRYSIAGRLMKVWEWADTVVGPDDVDADGHAYVTLTPSQFPFLDEIAGLPGFARSMADVGWLKDRNGRLVLPNFGRHNGETAKSRAQAQKRKQRQRQSVTSASRSCHANSVTREEIEKSREDFRSKESANALSSAEPDEPASTEVVFLTYPVVGGRGQNKPPDWSLTESHVERLREEFPGVDIEAEARKARGWCIDNPTKRKTARGMPKFIRGWMERQQNRCGSGAGPPRGSAGGFESKSERRRREIQEAFND